LILRFFKETAILSKRNITGYDKVCLGYQASAS
jgi:hypothetical protein